MNTEQIHTLAASCLLVAAGVAAFPYRLGRVNTSWLPRKLRPGKEYLDRPYEYGYPARCVDLLFSVSVAVVGAVALLGVLVPELEGGLPVATWFSALFLLVPACAVCRVLFWRRDRGDGFCYAGALTSFGYGKVAAVLLVPALLFLLRLAGLLPLAPYRAAAVAFCVLCCLFLACDYLRVLRLRGANEYSYPIGWREMYPESLNLLALPPLAASAGLALWWRPALCALVFGLLLLVCVVARHVCRFHPSVGGDERERGGPLLYWRRDRNVNS